MSFTKFLNLWDKGKIYFIPDAANYWHTITPCNIQVPPDKPGKYFLDFSSKANYAEELDKNGVPLFKLLDEIPQTYHPIAICQYALGLYDLLIDSDFTNINYKIKFLIQANWLVENKLENNKGVVWFFNYPDKRYNIPPNWCSAMAQGEAISVLIRAYSLTSEKLYLETAEAAIKPFKIKVADGGVLSDFNSIPVYEEFPAPKITGVLNGYIFSLFGLYDLWLTNDSHEAQALFDEGINAVLKLLKFYDLGYWSRYDIYEYPLKNPASFTYHCLHVEQLKVLFILTGNKIFAEYSEKWNNQSKKLINKVRALSQKIYYLRKIKAL